MQKNTSTTLYFVLLDSSTGTAVTTGSPAAHIASGGSVSATTNSVSYVNNNLWQLVLTAAETNVESLTVVVSLAGASPWSQQFFPRFHWPVSQVAIDPLRVALLKKTTTGLAGAFPQTLTVGDAKLFAIDFKHDMPVNGRFSELTEIAIAAGATGGITFDTSQQGTDRQQVKLHITGVTAGTYTISAKVKYQPNDDTAIGYATLTVAETL